MEQRPPQPPEGKLLAAALEHSGLSIRKAAEKADISYGRWRQVVSGVQHVSPGEYAKVHAPAKTLARMAAAVAVSPEQLETEGQRPDAAAELRRIQHEGRAGAVLPAPGDVPLGMTPEFAKAMQPHLEYVQGRLKEARDAYPGLPRIPGMMLFPGERFSALAWDIAAAEGFGEDGAVRLVAALRTDRGFHPPAGTGSGAGSGTNG